MSQKPNALEMFKNITPVDRRPKAKNAGKAAEKNDTENTAAGDREKQPGAKRKDTAGTGKTHEEDGAPDVRNVNAAAEESPETDAHVPTGRKLTIYHVDEGMATKLVSIRMLDEEFMKLKLYSLKNGIPKYEVVHSMIQSEMEYDEATGFPTDEFIVQHALETVKNRVSRRQKCAFRLTPEDTEFADRMSRTCAMTKQEYYIYLLNEYIR